MPVSGLPARSPARVSGGESPSSTPRPAAPSTPARVSGGESSSSSTRPFLVPATVSSPRSAVSTFWAGMWNVAALPWQMLSMFMPRAPSAPVAPATPARVSGGESPSSPRAPAAPARPSTPARVSGGESSSSAARVSGGE